MTGPYCGGPLPNPFSGAYAAPLAKTIPDKVKYNAADNSVTLTFNAGFAPDMYTFTVNNDYIFDEFGNKMQASFSTNLFMPVGAETPTVSRGITGATGPYVEFSEYTKPREIVDGFNPSDHVETRVSRLYYSRDAHRVAQIINRDAKSYN